MQSRDHVEKYGTGTHYDIPAAVFELLLDRHMNYSCGYYRKGDEDLDTAQIEKMRGIAHHLGLSKGHRILDLGCGWCGPALYFVEYFSCHVTGVTLSPVQRDFALQWATRRGLTGRLEVELQDVMDLHYPQNSFDHIILLESIIHMPQKEALFARCYDMLTPGGKILIQESHYDRSSMRSRYLSDPGFVEVNRAFGFTGDLVSGSEMLGYLEEARLVPGHLENISFHYQRTLTQWLDRLDTHAELIRSHSERAYRMLRRYLMIALTTYRSGQTVCYQIMAQKVCP